MAPAGSGAAARHGRAWGRGPHAPEEPGVGAPGGRGAAANDTEQGAYLVLYALLAVVLFTMAALVLDIAALRQGRRIDRTAVDLAATAGMVELDPGDATSYAAACRAAWGYVVANRSEAPGAAAPPDCDATFPSTTSCSSLLGARTASGTLGPLTVEITHPVPDTSPLMAAEAQGGDIPQALEPSRDGASCERLAVRVVRIRQFLFGDLMGSASGTTDVHSVARATITSSPEIPAVVALERTGCDGLSSSPEGGSLDIGAVGQPGVAAVDSDASTCASGFAIAPGDPGRIRALDFSATPGVIASFALSGANFARAYDPAAVAGGRLSPMPTPTLSRTGPGIVGNRYNCALSTCAAGTNHVDQLETALQGPGSPAGYSVYTGPCALGPADPPVLFTGNTFVDCPLLDIGNSVTFSATSVVFAGGVVVRDTGCLALNDTSCGAVGVPLQDGVAFLRSGDLTKEPKGRVVLTRAFVYSTGAVVVPQDPDAAPDGLLIWTAPLAGAFEDLLLWTESASSMRLGTQDFILVEGTLFAPNATFVLATRSVSSSTTVPAQVVAGRVRLEGPKNFTLLPAAGRATGRLTRQIRLIR
ncbi:MAG: hypothetical protein KY439_08780 [Actinobacteria bacterium]|nr:hypothetical protein [Actinomycetota bacterium]